MHARSTAPQLAWLFLWLFVAGVFGAHARAQCATQWLPGGWAAGTNDQVFAMTIWDQDGPRPKPPLLVVGGSFTVAGTVSASRIALYDPASGVWSALGTGMDASVFALATLPSGDLVAGGAFTTAGGVSAKKIARWNGANWSTLGTGIWSGQVTALTTLPNGDLIAGGYFGNVGGVSANNIARWQGTTWSPLGGGVDMTSGWPDVFALTTLPNGDLVAGGYFNTAGGVTVSRVARWNGTSWSALGPGVAGTVYALTTLPNGDLVVGGDFPTAGGVSASRIARWNGTSWSALGAGMGGSSVVVSALTVLPNGDLVAGGLFNTPGNNIARWNGTSWSALGTGVNDWVFAATPAPNGDLVAGGRLTTAGGQASAYLARLTTSCPAVSTAYALGCPSSGGSNTLVATTPPWVDATFRATGTGLPTNALVLTLTSVTSLPQGVAPLTLAFSQAGPGCDVLVAPDILGVLVTTTGVAQSSFFLPNTPPLVGVTFYHQMVPIELDAFGNWVAVTATNALQLTAGMF